MNIEVLNTNSLVKIIDYLIQNRSNKEKVLNDLGEVEEANGYGTVFLKHENRNVWISFLHFENDKINSAGIGAYNSQLKLKDLFEFFKYFKEGFERYDDQYVYVFYEDVTGDYAVKISSEEKLAEDFIRQSNLIITSLIINLR